MFRRASALTAPPAAGCGDPPGTPEVWYSGADPSGDGSTADGATVTTWVDKGSLGVDLTALATREGTFRSAYGGLGGYMAGDAADARAAG